jgi:DNA primase
VAVTSAGGAHAADKNDWEPLRGRCVVVFPDNDKAGAEYARDVAAIAIGVGCEEVGIIDVTKLVEIDGGARRPESQS